MEKLVASLSPVEKKLVPLLQSRQTVTELAETAKIQHVEAMRGCQFLSNKKVLEISQEVDAYWTISERGRDVIAHGFPEERLLHALEEPVPFQKLGEKSGLDKDEVNISIGLLKKAKLIQLGKEVQKTGDLDFSKKKQALEQPNEKHAQDYIKEFDRRGLIEKQEKTRYVVTLTKKGKDLQKQDLSKIYTEKLTASMLTSGSWKKQEFRRYDVTTPVPSAAFGRKHFVNEAISFIKQIWIEMGFTEMTGNMVQSAFWDLDALFVPQDHPAREMQDTFYVPGEAKLPGFWKDVKAVHEDGGDTGSIGWKTTYSEEEAKKLLLRTHTTVLSAQMLKGLDPANLPAKYFSVHKVFRNETLDWKHLFEFHQVEGIVVGEDLSLGDLIGLQKEFYKKMGFDKIRFRPAYFPYTMCSAEVEVYHPRKQQWVELGGMGVFRPELVIPLLGIDVPVLAWGLGMERIITDYFGITDLRHIYNNDAKKLREMKKFFLCQQ